MPLLSNLLNYAEVALTFVVMISILVAAHEFGHYIFARLFNMGVEEFAIGFGKPTLLTYMRRTYDLTIKPGENPQIENMSAGLSFEAGSAGSALEGGSQTRTVTVVDTPNGKALRETTNFTIRPWPLGGFVRIKGMMPEEDGKEVQVPGGFYSKAPWQRFLVLLAGPAFSVLAGIVLLVPLFMVNGVSQMSRSTKLTQMTSDGAAYAAGLREQDKILAIDGKPVNTLYDIVQVVRRSAGKPLEFTYERAGVRKEVVVTPKLSKDPQPIFGPNLEPLDDNLRRIGQIGIGMSFEKVPVSFVSAWSKAWATPWSALTSIGRVFQKPSTFSQNVGGPGTIIKQTADSVQQGPADVIELAALLSISVGIFNLLPIWPLDGGQMAVAIAEMLRGGRRLSMRVQNAIGTLGFALVLTLMFSVIVVDVQRLSKHEDPKPAKTTPALKAEPAKKTSE